MKIIEQNCYTRTTNSTRLLTRRRGIRRFI